MAALTTCVGAHLPGNDPLAEAEELGADCIQIFVSDPQSFKKPPPHAHAAALRASPLPVYVHAPYLINVCSPVPNRRYGGRKILQQTCDAAAAVGAAAVIVHGGHAEDDVNEGFGRWARTLEQLKTTVPIFDPRCREPGDHRAARGVERRARHRPRGHRVRSRSARRLF